jgi:hypothetical protein
MPPDYFFAIFAILRATSPMLTPPRYPLSLDTTLFSLNISPLRHYFAIAIDISFSFDADAASAAMPLTPPR